VRPALGSALVVLAVVLIGLLASTESQSPSSRSPEASGGAGTQRVPEPRPFIAYSETSFFRTPLPDLAPVDPESDRGIAFVQRRDSSRYPLIRGVEGDDWGMPFALGTCADPIWTLQGRKVPEEVSFLTTEGFHAPSSLGGSLTLTNDSPMVVVDLCGTPSMPRGLSVWAADVRPLGPQTLRVGAAGAFQHDSNGLDSRNPRSDSELNFRGRGAIPDAMVIRDDLLEWAMATDGDLGHVLHMFWWETDTEAGFVHPMVGDESDKHGFGPEGIRIRVRPEVDLTERDCSRAGLVVARTLQRFGAYLGDNSGAATSLKAQQGSTLITQDALSCLTWDDFAFVQRGWDPSLGG
jgi:hypothetical protein